MKLIVAIAIVLRLITGVCYAGNTGPFCGFKVCEIAHPDICWTIGLWTKANTCADFAGSFVCEHGPRCILDHGSECACIGPGIAETAGLFISKTCTCDYGLKTGCYVFDHGDLKGPMNLKACKTVSALIYGGDSECWCMGGGNREGSKGGP